MNMPKTMVSGRPTELPYLTGMRGYAATAVMVAHVTGTFAPTLPTIISQLFRLGPNGVYVFFVLSAFTITLSLRVGFNPVEYAIKRFFRIAPAYYLMLALMLVLGGSYWAEHFDAPYDFSSFIYHLTFQNWQDYTQANNAIGVEWTLSIEMLYYAFIPIMIYASRTMTGCISLIAFGTVMVFAAGSGTPSEAYKWAPWPYFICFAAGVVTFRIRDHVGPFCGSTGSAAVLVAVAAALLLSPLPGFEGTLIWWTAVTCVLIISGESRIGRALFENRTALYLGRLSYSLYLVHLPIVTLFLTFASGWVGTALTLICSLVAAEYLHRQIELPGQSVGKAVVARLPRRYSSRVNLLNNQGAAALG